MDEKTIGSNMRAIREQAGLTVTAAAARANLTKGTLSKIEKAQVSPPISTLVRIASALNVELASFFTKPDQTPVAVFTRHNQGRIITRDGSRFGYAYEALALDMPGKTAEPFVLTIEPGDPAGHFQHQGQEFIYMLAGTIEFSVGEQVFTMRKGDSLYLNATIPHATRVIGTKAARFICMFIDNHTNAFSSLPSSATPASAQSSRVKKSRTRPGRPGDKLK